MKKIPRITKKCPRCNTQFIVGGRAGNIKKVFCSKKCVLIGRPGRSYGWRKPGLEPTEKALKIDIAWASGIYEGEGWCSVIPNMKGHKTQGVYVGQKDTWILFRLKALFGGSITSRTQGQYENQNIWHIHGSRAREFLAIIYPFMSPRRKKQINKVL